MSVDSAGRRRTEASQLRALTGRLRLWLSPVPLPVELDLVPWGRWRTMVTLRPDRRLGWSVGAHRRSRYFATGHAAMDVVIAELCSLAGGARAAGLLRCAAMRALVVHADPSPDSLSAALFDTATTTLRRCGHEVAALDLYAEHFAPAMSAEERRAYLTDSPICSEQVARHAELVRWADTLVFVYPTWWAGPPAALKGWLERVLVPGVAFHLDERTNKVVSDLRHVRAVVGISTYRSSWGAVRLVHDSGRRILAAGAAHAVLADLPDEVAGALLGRHRVRGPAGGLPGPAVEQRLARL